jgi:hypothetical protein
MFDAARDRELMQQLTQAVRKHLLGDVFGPV